jgi:hypothetical protein
MLDRLTGNITHLVIVKDSLSAFVACHVRLLVFVVSVVEIIAREAKVGTCIISFADYLSKIIIGGLRRWLASVKSLDRTR